MSNQLIINSDTESVDAFLRAKSRECDEIKLAVAFASDREIFKYWLQKKIKISCIFALQPPTDPALLRMLLPYPASKVEIKFFDSRFHSKIYLFYKNDNLLGALVGSSNMTGGGLQKNIESNVFVTESSFLDKIRDHYQVIWNEAASLSPDDIHAYESIYERSRRERVRLTKEQDTYERQAVRPRLSASTNRIVKKGEEYYAFWRCMDDVVKRLGNQIAREFPGQYPYMVADYFWQYIVAVWKKDRRQNERYRTPISTEKLRILFRQFVHWDRDESAGTEYRDPRIRFFQRVLKKSRIHQLTKSTASELYRNLHSGGMRTQRFASDKQFVRYNSIHNIRHSLDYLLHSNDDIALRISALMVDPEYKLQGFGPNNIQEIIGWVYPDKMPIRNGKSDEAIELLGYSLK